MACNFVVWEFYILVDIAVCIVDSVFDCIRKVITIGQGT